MDRAFFGQGVFAIFSTQEKAARYMNSEAREGPGCEIRTMGVMGKAECDDRVFAAYAYNGVYDVYIFDGLYGEVLDARDAAGHKGLVMEFGIDTSHKKHLP
jgi:hypothetical protein